MNTRNVCYGKDITKGMEVDFFVGYNMAEDGFGKARIDDIYERIDGHRVVISICGDDGIFEEPWDMSIEEFDDSQRFLEFVTNSVANN